jgi:hypothetical protein
MKIIIFIFLSILINLIQANDFFIQKHALAFSTGYNSGNNIRIHQKKEKKDKG